jgi:hypothetical protein
VSATKPVADGLGARLAKRWVHAYTRGLDAEVRDARCAEIDSDIFEHQQIGTNHGQRRVGAAIAGRTLRGVLGDLAWRREERAMTQTHTATPERRSTPRTGPARHLRWLALILLVPAAVILFFGILWTEAVQIGLGFALMLTAAAIWRVFSGEWPFGLARQ